MNFTFIHGLGVCQYLCLIIAEYCFVVRIYHNLFIHLPDDGHFGALMDKSALNMGKTCKLKAVSFQCMTKFTTNLKKKIKIKRKKNLL